MGVAPKKFQITAACFTFMHTHWMDVFDNFLHEVCDQFENMVISGDFNLADIQFGTPLTAHRVLRN